jgi:hypothetical protein
MRKRLLLSTVALVAGLAITPAANMPAGAQGAAQPQGGAATQERQQHGGQAQRAQDQGKQGQSQRSQGQQQRDQTTGQAPQGQREPSKQGQREQSKQGQRDQGMQQGQSKPDQTQQRNQGQRDQTTGQAQRDQSQRGQRDQTQGQAPQRQQREQGQAQQPAQGQAQQPQQGQTQQGQTQQGQAQQGQAQQGQAQQGPAGGAVNLTSEQRTRIQQTVFARNDLPRVNSVNFSLSVGTVVPSRVRIVDVDPVLIEFFPQYRGHKYFVVRDEIVIVDNSRKVVAVMPVGSGRGGARLESGGKVSGGAGAIDLAPDQIRQVQMVLIEKGFDIGEPDGRLGPRTTRALIAFQRQQGFQATGQIDSRTMTALGVSGTTGQGNQGANQPSTSGQGGTGTQPPANQNMGAGQQGKENQPSTSGQGGAGQQPSANQNMGDGKEGAKEPSTTGQGSEKMQPSGKDNAGAGQNPPTNRPADQRSNPESGK